jgi:Bifunctional DNA primase/polymerase, N-terminal/AAA domain
MRKTPSEIALAAFAYASNGHPVIPLESVRGDGTCTCGSLRCASPGKHPVAHLAPNGKNDATTDTDTVNSWDGEMQNVAIRTDGLLVIDIDGQPGIDSYRKLVEDVGPLPVTRKQSTGRGWHLLYRIPADVQISQSTRPLGDPIGIDLRANDRGYIVVAPSKHPSGSTYDWFDNSVPIADLPQAWIDRLTQPIREERVIEPVVVPDGIHGTPYGLAALRGEADRVRNTAEGGRNNTLNSAAYAIGQLIGSGHVSDEDYAADVLMAAAEECGLPFGEADQTILRGFAAGINNPRAPLVVEDDADPGGEPSPIPHVLTAAQLVAASKTLPQIPILVGEQGDVLLGQGELLLLAASPGVGKTTLTLDAIAHLASGREWLGWPVPRPLKFLILENEGSLQSFASKIEQKIEAWAAAGREPFADNVFVWNGDPLRGWSQIDLLDDQTLAKLRLDIDQYAIDVVVCDSVASMAAEGHGAAPEVEAMVKRLKTTNAAFWLLHHNNKSQITADSPEKTSGTWARPVDAVIALESGGAFTTKLRYTKLRHATPDGVWHLLKWNLDTQGFEETATSESVSEDDMRERIIEAMKDLPPKVSQRQLRDKVAGKTALVSQTVKTMIEDGSLLNSGDSHNYELSLPNDPFDLPF